jgi:hypothetical protein
MALDNEDAAAHIACGGGRRWSWRKVLTEGVDSSATLVACHALRLQAATRALVRAICARWIIGSSMGAGDEQQPGLFMMRSTCDARPWPRRLMVESCCSVPQSVPDRRYLRVFAWHQIRSPAAAARGTLRPTNATLLIDYRFVHAEWWMRGIR